MSLVVRAHAGENGRIHWATESPRLHAQIFVVVPSPCVQCRRALERDSHLQRSVEGATLVVFDPELQLHRIAFVHRPTQCMREVAHVLARPCSRLRTPSWALQGRACYHD